MKIGKRGVQITLTVLLGSFVAPFATLFIACFGSTIGIPHGLSDPGDAIFSLLLLTITGCWIFCGWLLIFRLWKRFSRRTVRECCGVAAFALWSIANVLFWKLMNKYLPSVNLHSELYTTVEGIRGVGSFVLIFICFILYRDVVDWLCLKLDLPPEPSDEKQEKVNMP